MLIGNLASVFLALLTAGSASSGSEAVRKIFAFDESGAAVDWYAIDDRVMGGVSRSRMEAASHGASFSGMMSLDSGGGFASVRSPDGRFDLSDAEAVVLRVRGAGKRYKLALRTTERFDGVVYQASFDAPAGEWRDVVLPLARFKATWRGRAVPDAAPLDRGNVVSFGLLISDRQAGPFRLDIAWIGAAAADDDE